MSRHQFTIGRSSNPKRHRGQPDLAAEFDVVHPKIADATRIASAKLTELDVRHVLIGGLAVGAYARPRATKDVDFLVGPEAWPTKGVIVSPIAELPISIYGVDVDHLLVPEQAPGIEEALARGNTSENIPVAPIETIILMKLIADRPQDRADVDALLDVANIKTVQQYVTKYAPDYLETLGAALEEHARTRNVI